MTAVQLWVGTIELGLPETYLPGTRVRDEWLVGTTMMPNVKWSFFSLTEAQAGLWRQEPEPKPQRSAASRLALQDFLALSSRSGPSAQGQHDL